MNPEEYAKFWKKRAKFFERMAKKYTRYGEAHFEDVGKYYFSLATEYAKRSVEMYCESKDM